MKYLDLTHRTGHALAFNPVADFERAEQQHNKSACKILQVSGQRHTHRHTGRCQQGSERGCFHSQLTDNGYNQQDRQQYVHQTLDEALNTGINMSLHKKLRHKFLDERDKEPSDYKN